MARIRYIKPDFWKDEDIAELPYQVRLFYIGLWNFADKAGRLEDRPKWLKVEIFPYEKADIEKMLKLLIKPKSNSKRPFIQRYESNGKRYIQIVAWPEHQKPHHQEQESKILPAPPLTIMETLMGTESVLDEPAPNKHRTSTEVNKIPAIIQDLNDVCKTAYKPASLATRELITARLKEGHTIEDFKTVHRKKAKEWLNDEKMAKFLRPATLYAKSKFEGYLNQLEAKPKKGIERFIKEN